MGAKRNVYRVFVGTPDSRRQVGRPIHRWEHNIKMNLREIRWYGLD
jgi:hypothetical protein